MGDKLTKQDKTFVKELVETGNKTQSAIKAYGYKNENTAGVMALDKLRKPKIIEAIQSIAESFTNDEIVAKHKELLNAVNLEKLSFSPKDTDEEISKVVENMEGYKLLYIKSYENSDGKITDKYAYVKAPDNQTQDKALDKVYKLKGAYAPDKSINLNIEAEITNPKARELAEKYEEELKKNL